MPSRAKHLLYVPDPCQVLYVRSTLGIILLFHFTGKEMRPPERGKDLPQVRSKAQIQTHVVQSSCVPQDSGQKA